MTRIALTAAAIAMLLATSASAAEPRILYRSATTGTAVPAAAPTMPTAPTAPTYPPLTVTLAGNANVKVGSNISIQVVTDGGSGDFGYDLITMIGMGLPGGLSLDQSGKLSGVSFSVGNYPIGISVYDRKTHAFADSPMITVKISQ
jgi:hypothetical protein